MACVDDNSEPCALAPLGKFLDRSGKVDDVEVWRCNRCGHGVSMPQIPDVSFLYEARESQDYQPDTKGLSRTIKDMAFGLQARRILRQANGAKGSILDFGCGSGQFTRVLGDVAPGSEVVGADMHPDCPAELQGRAYLDPDQLSERKGSFDVVMAMHVLEHDDDAQTLLSTIAGYARAGGTIIIEVPNIDCAWSRWLGKYWDAWYLPYHRQHFTRASLIGLMQRAGLKIESVHGVTVPTMGRSFANVFGQSNNLGWLLLGILAHPVQVAGEALTKQPSAIRIIARRPT